MPQCQNAQGRNHSGPMNGVHISNNELRSSVSAATMRHLPKSSEKVSSFQV